MAVVIPHQFANRQGNVPALELDEDFNALANAIGNGINVVNVSPTNTAAQNRAIIQAAHDALPASGGILQFAQYGIHIDAEIAVTKPALILGPGGTQVSTPGAFVLYLDTVAQNGFNVTGKGPFAMQNFSILGAPTTKHVVLNGPPGTYKGTESCRFDNVIFSGGATHIDQQAAIFTAISRCGFFDMTAEAVSIQNTIDPDQSDATIYGCTFLGPAATPAALLWKSGGGLRFVNNKVLGFSTGLTFDVAGDTQDFILADNSIESFDLIGIQVIRSGGAAKILYMNIHDNQVSRLAGGGGGTPNWGIAFGTNNATYVADVQLHHNTISDVAVGVLMNGGTRFAIDNNKLLRITTGDAQGFKVEGAATTVYIGRNEYTSVTTPLAGAALGQVALVDSRLGYVVADLPGGLEVGSMVFATDALGPGDGGYTGYGMVAAGGGSGALAIRQNGQWRC